jgi:hypothetical protein
MYLSYRKITFLKVRGKEGKKMKKILTVSLIALFVICFAGIGPASAVTQTVLLKEGISFQDPEVEIDGSTNPFQSVDDTAKLKFLDTLEGPTIVPPVNGGFYATGTSYYWFDAISAKFDLSGIGYSNIYSLSVSAYIETGAYFRQNWHHYAFYEGAFNPTNEDADPVVPLNSNNTIPGLTSFDPVAYGPGGWVNFDIPMSWVTSDDFDITFRIWNADVDQIKLNANVVPEPATMALVGFGMLGLGAIRRSRKKSL